jgi:hypothetical protein
VLTGEVRVEGERGMRRKMIAMTRTGKVDTRNWRSK